MIFVYNPYFCDAGIDFTKTLFSSGLPCLSVMHEKYFSSSETGVYEVTGSYESCSYGVDTVCSRFAAGQLQLTGFVVVFPRFDVEGEDGVNVLQVNQRRKVLSLLAFDALHYLTMCELAIPNLTITCVSEFQYDNGKRFYPSYFCSRLPAQDFENSVSLLSRHCTLASNFQLARIEIEPFSLEENRSMVIDRFLRREGEKLGILI